MATGYATIHQYQPLRAPKSFDREGRALILQLDEIFDDIYKRFGRLKLSDLGTTFRTDITDNWEETAELNDRTTVIEQKLTTQANVYRQAEQPTGNLKDGDIWMQVQETFTWEEMGNFTWNDLNTETWGLWEGLAEIWVYDASSETFLKSYSGAEIASMQTNIVQTESDIALLAEETAVLQEGLQTNSAMILVNAQSILNEVSRATNAESAKIDKTSTYQTVDAIISEAATLADAAEATAKAASIAKTETYQTADSIYTAAVAAAETAAGNTYIAKTNTYQTADAIYSAAAGYVDGELQDYSTTTQMNDAISSYVGTYVSGQLENYSTTSQTADAISAYVTNNAYQLVSGIAIDASGVDVTGSKYVKIRSGGTFDVDSDNMIIDSSAGAFVNKIYNWALQDTVYFSIGWSEVLRNQDLYAIIQSRALIKQIGQDQITTYPLYLSVSDSVIDSAYQGVASMSIGYDYEYVSDPNAKQIMPVVRFEELKTRKSDSTTTYGSVLLLTDYIRCGSLNCRADIKAFAGYFTDLSVKGSNAGLRVYNDTTNADIYLYSLSNGEHGVYSSGYWNGSSYTSSGTWMIYRDAAGKVKIGGSLKYVDTSFTWNDLET